MKLTRILYMVLILTISPLCGMEEETPLQKMPEDVKQLILFSQFTTIPDNSNTYDHALEYIVVFKRINKASYNYVNQPSTIIPMIKKMHDNFPKEAKTSSMQRTLNIPAIKDYYNKSIMLIPNYNDKINPTQIAELVHEGADINCIIEHHSGSRATPLMFYAGNQHYQELNQLDLQKNCIQILLELEADQNIIIENRSALQYADEFNNITIVNLLLDHNPSHEILQSSLATSIYKEHDDIAQAIIAKIEKSLEHISKDLTPGLLAATKCNNTIYVSLLLRKGANPNEALQFITTKILEKTLKNELVDDSLYSLFELLCQYYKGNPEENNAFKILQNLNNVQTMLLKMLLNTITNNNITETDFQKIC